ncbi:MAG: hypothetical protein ABL925_18675 [Methylococcales bacterium]
MKKTIILAMAMLFSGNVLAATDHYVLRDGNYVRHLKVTKSNDEYLVSADVDFDSTGAEASDRCSASLSGEAKSTAANELVLKKHSEIEASYCELKIQLSPTGAKIEQAQDCGSFGFGKCSFSSAGKELLKVK